MGLTGLLLSFCFYTLWLSRCLAYTNKITLDLALLDTPKVHVFEGFEHGAIFGSYMVNRGFNLSSVMENGVTIWTAKEDERGVLTVLYRYGDFALAVIDTRREKESALYCYEKDGEAWKEVTEEDADKNLRRIRMENSGYDLDIYNIDPFKVSVDEEEKDGVVTHLYTPKPGVDMLSVSDRGDLVWLAENYQKCGYAKVTTWDDFELMHLYVLGPKGDRYFKRKPGSGWAKVSRNEFYEDEMRTKKMVTTLQSTEDCTLDIVKPDKTKIEKSRRSCAGLKCRAYRVKPGYAIMTIMDGTREIWKAFGNERCTLATLYSKKGAKILTLYLRDGDKTTPVRFEKRNGEWNGTTNKGFNDLLKELKGPLGRNWDNTHELDISYPNVTLVEVTRNVTSKVTATTYTPKQDASILIVVDDTSEIWRIGGDRIKLVYVRRVESETDELLTIYTKDHQIPRLLFFEKDGGVWKEIKKGEYDRRLKVFKAKNVAE